MAELKIQVGKANQLVIRASGDDIFVDNEAVAWLEKNWQWRNKGKEPLVISGIFLSNDEVSLTFMTKKDFGSI
ncbi:hypothetical protein KKA27_01715 [Patescibacteria group bacterium]|nr:hypothetical protein [Patescibacteria group bacterium]